MNTEGRQPKSPSLADMGKAKRNSAFGDELSPEFIADQLDNYAGNGGSPRAGFLGEAASLLRTYAHMVRERDFLCKELADWAETTDDQKIEFKCNDILAECAYIDSWETNVNGRK